MNQAHPAGITGLLGVKKNKHKVSAGHGIEGNVKCRSCGFPEILICANYGNAEFTLSEEELSVLANGAVAGSST